MENGQPLLHDPAIAPQPFAGFDTLAGNAWRDMPVPQSLSICSRLIAFVCVQLLRSATRTSSTPSYVRNRIYQGQKGCHLVEVGSAERDSKGVTFEVDEQMVLAARFTPVCGVRTREVPFLKARTLAASMAARVQSISPSKPNSFKRLRCNWIHTPASCHSWSLRQQVMPLTPKTSRGNSSHWIPVLRTKTIPRRHARSLARGRPPFRCG